MEGALSSGRADDASIAGVGTAVSIPGMIGAPPPPPLPVTPHSQQAMLNAQQQQQQQAALSSGVGGAHSRALSARSRACGQCSACRRRADCGTCATCVENQRAEMAANASGVFAPPLRRQCKQRVCTGNQFPLQAFVAPVFRVSLPMYSTRSESY